jgi:hypothetical protein
MSVALFLMKDKISNSRSYLMTKSTVKFVLDCLGNREAELA